MGKKIVQAIKDKIAYEKESYRMSGEYLKQLKKDHPEQWEWRRKNK